MMMATDGETNNNSSSTTAAPAETMPTAMTTTNNCKEEIIGNGNNATSIANNAMSSASEQHATSAPSRFNVNIRAKTKILREMWSQNRVKLDKDHSQLLVIVMMSVIAVGCSLAALTSDYWTCDPNRSMYRGLWNTCQMSIIDGKQHRQTTGLVDNQNQTMNHTMTIINSTTMNGILCASQGFNEIHIEYAEKSRIDQVSASQGLIISGTILYVVSIISISLAYKYINVKNLNSVRNALVTSMCIQIISFFLQLIGFFMFILTDRISMSIGLLFVYFGLAIFATNIINFITIEYKSYKTRQLSI
jgi:hypothetical protein